MPYYGLNRSYPVLLGGKRMALKNPEQSEITNEKDMETSIQSSSDEDGIHVHCFSCYSMHCTQFRKCSLIHCSNHCGTKYHACKDNEHKTICRKQSRPCANYFNGCPFKLDSVSMMSHLACCPASVICCGMNWNRYPLYSKVREQRLPFWQGNPVQVDGDLDTEFALSDQKHLNKEFRSRMKRGKSHVPQPSNDNISKLDSQRCIQLESLLHNVDQHPQSHAMHKNGGCGTVPKSVIERGAVEEGTENKVLTREEESDEDEFVTYDEVVSSGSSNVATIVSNTNIRSGYFDLPYKSSDGECYKIDFVVRDEKQKRKSYLVSEELKLITKSEMMSRVEVYSNINQAGYFPLGLNITIEAMPKFQNQYPMYSFSCSKVFRRDQYAWHCENIHGDIQSGLNGWVIERCPLVYYGCPYVQFRLTPRCRTVRFLRMFSCFTDTWDLDMVNREENATTTTLIDLPREVIVYILYFLDNLSLNCIAKTCHTLRDLCYDLLDNRGIILSTWSKKSYQKSGTTFWKEERKVRLFTTSCSPMREWVYTYNPPIGNHMRTCPFFKRKELFNKVKLPMDGLQETKVKPKVYIRPRSYHSPSTSEGSDDNADGDDELEYS